jgi:hypothetical protein
MIEKHTLRIVPMVCVALLLMGMGVRCTHTTEPLSTMKDGFVDPYLIGRWRVLEMDEDERELYADDLAYEVLPDPTDKVVRIRSFGSEGRVSVYEGYTTRLNGRKYLNAWLVDCVGCDSAPLKDDFSSDCSYTIIEYATYVPNNFVSLMTTETDLTEKEAKALFAGWRGRLLFIQYMENSFVVDAIRAGTIEGELSCDDCDSPAACITEDSEILQDFIRSHGADIYAYPDMEFQIFIREAPSIL